MTGPRTLTVAEAAQALGRSPRLVRKLIDEGRLEVVPDTDPVRVTARSVKGEQRRREDLPPTAQPALRVTVDDLATIVTAATREAYRQGAADLAEVLADLIARGALTELPPKADAARPRGPNPAREKTHQSVHPPIADPDRPVAAASVLDRALAEVPTVDLAAALTAGVDLPVMTPEDLAGPTRDDPADRPRRKARRTVRDAAAVIGLNLPDLDR